MNTCYTCKFRGTVPGSVHSSCKVIPEDKAFKLALLYLSGRQLLITSEDKPPEPLIELDSHGISNGWATWPIDFDPVWVSNCKLYSKTS